MRFVQNICRAPVVILTLVVLAGCVLGEKPGAAPKANPLATVPIATTALEVPKPAMVDASQSEPVKTEPAKAQPATSDPVKPATTKAEPAKTTPPTPPTPPPEPASPAEAKCLKSGGNWAGAGKTGAKVCVKLTKDAGKSCSKQSQCQGFCLARSRTCAPFTPMFGCNDILQDDGREVTLCLD